MEPKRPESFGGDKLDEFDTNYHILHVLEVIEELTGCKAVSCGAGCGATIIVKKDEPRPKFCSFCGVEIAWGNFLDTEHRQCPQCKIEYHKDVFYCENDGSKLTNL